MFVKNMFGMEFQSKWSKTVSFIFTPTCDVRIKFF